MIDVETTGFDANGADRIVEIAAFRVDGYGSPLAEYTTLLNPHRDTGASHIHGIQNADVQAAPEFRQVVGDILAVARDAILVAHNASFDMRFISAEMRRAGVRYLDPPVLCTLTVARHLVQEARNYKLGTLCDLFGIGLNDAHSARADAYATVLLLFRLLDRIRDWRSLRPEKYGVTGQVRHASKWPNIPASGFSYTREQAQYNLAGAPSPVQKVVASLPTVDNPNADVREYLMTLGRVLLDRQISSEDAHALYNAAVNHGMSQRQAVEENRRYLWNMALNCMRDGVMSEEERRDLAAIGGCLNIPYSDFAGLLSSAIGTSPTSLPPPPSGAVDLAGKRICFSGTFKCRVQGAPATKEKAAACAEALGAQVQKRLSKNLDVLVVHDPSKASSTTTKAREYGVTIIAEPAYWTLVGAQLE